MLRLQPPPPHRPQAETDSHTLTESWTTTDGFSFTTTVVLSDWIKASDVSGMASTWAAMGGKGSFRWPADDSGRINGDGALVGFIAERSAIVFGTYTINNTTSGFALALVEGLLHLWIGGSKTGQVRPISRFAPSWGAHHQTSAAVITSLNLTG